MQDNAAIAEPSLAARVAFLRQTAAYAGQTEAGDATVRVEAVETHMSWVFLTARHAWKLKKPVRYDEMDFRTLPARRFFCEEEVRLNRRLAPSVYLDTVPLSLDATGHLHLGPGARVVDWLVKMRRLPQEDMLEHALLRNAVTDDDMRRVGWRLAAFHGACAPESLTPQAYGDVLRRNIATNLDVLTRPEYGLLGDPIVRLCEQQEMLVTDQAERFATRIAQGCIVEGHGDLRPEHVCLRPEVVVIDCLEFARPLRVLDRLDEIGFLALECERLGRPDAGTPLLAAWREAMGEPDDAGLRHFYQGYRAALRARIAIRHLDEEAFRHSRHWRDRALHYMELARQHQALASAVIEPSS